MNNHKLPPKPRFKHKSFLKTDINGKIILPNTTRSLLTKLNQLLYAS